MKLLATQEAHTRKRFITPRRHQYHGFHILTRWEQIVGKLDKLLVVLLTEGLSQDQSLILLLHADEGVSPRVLGEGKTGFLQNAGHTRKRLFKT